MKHKMSDLYYCHECKVITKSLNDLYFVEENSTNGFCSEHCIEKYYKNIVQYFDSYNEIIFEELNLEFEIDHNETKLLESILKKPDKIYQWSNQMYSKITHFLGKVGETNVIVTCFLYEGSASFILGLTYHSDERIFDYFKKGEEKRIVINENDGVSKLSKDQLEIIEQKKGELLAKIIEIHSGKDISFESYPLYEKFVEPCLQAPDFKKLIDSTSHGDIYLYSKVFFEGDQNVYMVVANLESDTESGVILYVPSIFSDFTNTFFGENNFIKN